VTLEPGRQVGDAVDDGVGAGFEKALVGAGAGADAEAEASAGGASGLHIEGVIADDGCAIGTGADGVEGAQDVVGVGLGARDVVAGEEEVVVGEPVEDDVGRGAAVAGYECDGDAAGAQGMEGGRGARKKAGVPGGGRLDGNHGLFGLGAEGGAAISQLVGEGGDLLDDAANAERLGVHPPPGGNIGDGGAHGVEVVGAGCDRAVNIEDHGVYG
jgi:hypothetical protein